MIYSPVCLECESNDLYFNYNSNIYTCNDCGTKMHAETWHKFVKDDIEKTFINMLPYRRELIYKKAISD